MKNDFSEQFFAVVNFRSLGDGRRRKRIVLGTTSDIRTAQLLFETRIEHNWPSWNEIRFSNGKRFYIREETVDGARVHIFLWDKVSDFWYAQQLRTRIEYWLNDASGQDKLTVARWMIEERHLNWYVWHEQAADICLRKCLLRMDFPQLRFFSEIVGIEEQAESADRVALRAA